MAFTKANTLTITSGSPSGNTIYEAINYTDLNVDSIITDLNNIDERAPEYNILWIPAKQMTALTTNGAAAGTYEYATSDDVMLDYFAFDKTTEEYVGFTLVMPENWDRGTVKAKFYWAPGSTAGAVGETVEWQIQGITFQNTYNIDTTEFTDTGEVVVDTELTGENVIMHITSATPAITLNGTGVVGNLLYFKISRNVDGTDNMDCDAWLFGVAIQYRMTNTVTAW